MNYPEAIKFLYELRWFGLKLGLENTFKLAALAGNPQDRLRFIHVAGTNGKGSTCAMLDCIYRAAGQRVGLFTSPHLVSFRERLQVDRQLISETDVVRLVKELKELVAAGFQPALEPGVTPGGSAVASSGLVGTSPPSTDDKMPSSSSEGTLDALDRRDACPTFFEFVTVMALKYFAEQNCDLVIWETGMGGRLDATNIVMPLARVITNIQFDHQNWLGNTLEEIAAEKAGIIKPGVPAITATDATEALEVIARTARERNAALTLVNRREPTPNPSQEGNQRMSASADDRPISSPIVAGLVDEVDLPLLGEHQRMNAALAVATVRVLQNKIPVFDNAIKHGLAKVEWPGRLQLVTTSAGQTFLLDGAHNAAGAVALRDALRSGAIQKAIPVRLPPAKGTRDIWRQDAGSTLILGVLEDKDWQQVCATLAPLADRILLVPVPSERTAPPELLRDACAKINPAAQTIACPSLADALKQTANDPFVLITGSLYLVGEAMEWLELSPAPASGERGLNEWTLRK